MPAYLVSLIRITDPERYQDYVPISTSAVAKYGGRFVVRGGAPDTMEGSLGPNRVVVIEFESREEAKRFYNSPEYRVAREVRVGAADFNTSIADGY